jgi:hypothetical protein
MQKPPTSKKNIIIIAIVILLAIGAYFYFTGAPSDKAISSLDAGAADAAAADQLVGLQVVTLLNQLNSIHIDMALFNSPVYKSLVDHTVTVSEQNVGRPNPFAPAYNPAPPAKIQTKTR